MNIEHQWKNPELVARIEKECPTLTDEYKKIMYSQYEMFCAKQSNYGKGNIMLGGDIEKSQDRTVALSGLAIRLNDKCNRLINMVVRNTPDAVGESIVDTFADVAVYGIIAQIVNNGKWK